MPFTIRITIETERGPLSVLHVLAEIPKVGDKLELPGGRTVTVETVDIIRNGESVHATAVEVAPS